MESLFKRLVLFAALVLATPLLGLAQSNGTVSGHIVESETGNPLPGATVSLEGTQYGAAAGLDGTFEFSAPAGTYSLLARFVGYSEYRQPVTIVAGETVDVTIEMEESIIGLEDVVVTGYRVTRNRVETGSVATVQAPEIEKLTVRTPDAAIQGRAAGVRVTSASGQPGAAIDVRVRGTGSINAGTDPLFIIDGVQVNNDNETNLASGNPLVSISPGDIASIEVLKDASAASIYGAQAANGVVLITTKRGRAGATEINFNTQVGSVDRIKTFEVMNSEEWLNQRVISAMNQFGWTRAQAEEGIASAVGADPRTNTIDTNWQDAVFRTGVTQQYNLSMRGGNEKTTFYISGRYTNDQGQVIESLLEQGQLRMNFDHYVNDKLSLEAKVNLGTTRIRGTISNGPFINSPFWSAQFIPPTIPIYNVPGDPDSGLNVQPFVVFDRNPVAQEKFDERKTNTNAITTSAAANYEIIPGLFSRSFAGLQYQDGQEEDLRDLRQPANQAVGGSLSMFDTRTTTFNVSQTFTYSNVFSDVHRVSALAGAEYREREESDFSARGQGFPNELFRTLATAANPVGVGANNTEFRQFSGFGNVEYTYNDTYQLAGTLRYDGSSRFGVDKRWGAFGTVAGFWRISNTFFQDVEFLSDLKLRGSWGVTGNSNIGNFASRRLFAGAGEYIGQPGIRPSGLGNNLLTWESNWETNVGLDYNLFRGRIVGSVDVYRRNVKELLLNRDLPSDSGFGSLTENVGEVRNQGLEIALNTVNLNMGGFQWRTNFNISFQDSKVLKLAADDDEVQVNGFYYKVGEPVRQYKFARYVGVNPANGKLLYLDADDNLTYSPTTADRKLVGGPEADFFGGLGNSFSYKGVSLDVFFQYDYGRQTFNNNAWFSDCACFNFNKARRALDYWQNPGDIVHLPQPRWYGSWPDGSSESDSFRSTRFLEDASYIRLKQVTLTYALPTNILNRYLGGLRSASIWVQGENLYTWTEFTDSDPEIIGTALGEYPQSKRWTAGLRIGI